MKIVLLKSVDKLGTAGETVNVRPGYYRNFLGPRGMAVLATEANIKLVESRRKVLEAIVVKERSEAETVRAGINGKEVKFQLRANDKGQLFGAVNSVMVGEELHKLGFDIDRRKIEIGEQIKTLGPHKVRLRLYPEIFAEISVVVERALLPGEEDPANRQAPEKVGTGEFDQDLEDDE